MRINKYLAMKGYSTRRGADELIAKKIVTINGRSAVLGDKVNETDAVEVRKNKKADEYIYYACYKPAGITLLDTRKGQQGFSHTLPLKGVFPIGSLDRDAAGLIIFTNDRRIIDRLENPAHAHPKTYMVEVREPFRNNFKEKLEAGVTISNEGPSEKPAEKPIECHVAMKGQTAALITITDPKNRIRQICSLFGANVEKLTRTGILNITLGKLNPNGHRKIEGEELAAFLKSLGL
jgi:pseudouridine synthase